jgi:hypothetical protein
MTVMPNRAAKEFEMTETTSTDDERQCAGVVQRLARDDVGPSPRPDR